MTDPASLAPNQNMVQLQRLQAPDLTPALRQWMGAPEVLASLGTALPLTAPDQLGALFSRADVQVWGVRVGDRFQAVYVCSLHPQHQVMRLAFGAAPDAPGLALLRDSLPRLMEMQFASGVQKISCHLLASSIRKIWPLLRLNRHFFLEGRLRQEWLPALGCQDDVFIVSALAQAGLQPPPGSLWLNKSVASASHRFFRSWPSAAVGEQGSTPARLPSALVRGSTHIDTPAYHLRTLTAKDANETLVHWLNSPQLMGSMNLPRFTFSLPSLRALLAGFDRNFNQFIGVFHRSSGELIGFYTVLVNESARHAHLALCIYPSETSASRIMVDTITPLTDSYFERFAIDKITGSVLVSNRRMLLSLPHNYTFLFEGVLRQECQGEQGRLDVVVFSTFRDPALRPKLGRFVPA